MTLKKNPATYVKCKVCNKDILSKNYKRHLLTAIHCARAGVKPIYPVKKGKGILDVIKNPIATVKEAFRGNPSKYNYATKETLTEFGKNKIVSMKVARTPLNKLLTNIVDAISNNKFSELVKKYGIDDLFHLSLVVTLDNGQDIIIEKNEVINVNKLENSHTLNDKTEYLTVPIDPSKQITLNTLMKNTRLFMGDDYLGYEGMRNNCQNFIISILKSNHLLNKKISEFTYQNVAPVREELQKTGYAYVEKVMNGITNTASVLSRLTGRGKRKNQK